MITKNCSMNSNSLRNNPKKLHLKVIKSSLKKENSLKTKYYINTLVPGFNYLNDKGKIVTPKKCAY